MKELNTHLEAGGNGIPFRLVALGLTLLVLTVAGVIIHNLVQTSRQVQQLYAESIQGIEVNGVLMKHIQDARLYSLYTLASTDPNVQLESVDASRALDPKVAALLQEQTALFEKSDTPATGPELAAHWAAYRKVRDEVLATVLEGRREEGLQLDRRAGLAAFNRLHNALERSEEACTRQAATRLEQIQAVSRRNIFTVALMLFLMLVGAGMALRTLSRSARLLHRSRERFEIAVRGSSDGLWDWDLVTNAVYFSPRWKRMLGYADDELTNSLDSFRGLIHPDDAPLVMGKVEAYLKGALPTYEVEFRARLKDGEYRWILSRGAALRDMQGKAMRFAGSHTDITARKQAEAQIARMQRELMAASRTAGMAEVATGVLHNVGNVLNSVNVSLGVIHAKLDDSRVGRLGDACDLMAANRDNLGDYLTRDPKGSKLPEYLRALATGLRKERDDLKAEAATLLARVEHIKQIVASQQSFARQGGATERLSPVALFDEALKIQEGAFHRHHVRVVRENLTSKWVLADRHRTLQIIINLLGNAKAAMANLPLEDRRLILRLEAADQGRVCFSVIDSGCGISAENLAKIFRHGFTTKKEGHGFGLHSCANAAAEMKGSLHVQSDGPGTGAAFTLELPSVPAPGGTTVLQKRSTEESLSTLPLP